MASEVAGEGAAEEVLLLPLVVLLLPPLLLVLAPQLAPANLSWMSLAHWAKSAGTQSR
jgi:hypothetical protein